jgi:hypothetical protein
MGGKKDYFEGFDDISIESQEFLSKSVEFFERCGFIEFLLKQGLKARFEGLNGASFRMKDKVAVFDPDELDRELKFSKKFGAMMAVPGKPSPLLDIRLNLVIGHGLAHQILPLLKSDFRERIAALYAEKTQSCNHSSGESNKNVELLKPQEMPERHFVSSWARTDLAQYWAESFACFGRKDSKSMLEKIDAAMYSALREFFLHPENYMCSSCASSILEIRSANAISAETVNELLRYHGEDE